MSSNPERAAALLKQHAGMLAGLEQRYRAESSETFGRITEAVLEAFKRAYIGHLNSALMRGTDVRQDPLFQDAFGFGDPFRLFVAIVNDDVREPAAGVDVF